MNTAPQAEAGSDAGQAVFEEAARGAEEVAVDLVHRASALFWWASENRFTDPDPATPGAAADALEAHARALRELHTAP